MGEINTWPQGMVEIKEVEINIERNISSLSWGEKKIKLSIDLPCEINKNAKN